MNIIIYRGNASLTTPAGYEISNSSYNICDRLCENPPCKRANFDLFLQFQNAITFT